MNKIEKLEEYVEKICGDLIYLMIKTIEKEQMPSFMKAITISTIKKITKDTFVQVYNENLTEEDVNEMITLSETSLGKKMLEIQPKLIKKLEEETKTKLTPELTKTWEKIEKLEEKYKDGKITF